MNEKRAQDFIFDLENKDESYWRDVASLYKQNDNFNFNLAPILRITYLID